MQPRFSKFSKPHHFNLPNVTQNLSPNAKMGLKADEPKLISQNQINAVQSLISTNLGKKSGMIVRTCVFPNYPQTRQPLGTRMGRGKGKVDSWMIPIKKGSIIFEIQISKKVKKGALNDVKKDDFNYEIAFNALKKTKYKLGLKSTILKRFQAE